MTTVGRLTFMKVVWSFSPISLRIFVSGEEFRVTRRLSFGYFYSKASVMRLDIDYPPNPTFPPPTRRTICQPLLAKAAPFPQLENPRHLGLRWQSVAATALSSGRDALTTLKVILRAKAAARFACRPSPKLHPSASRLCLNLTERGCVEDQPQQVIPRYGWSRTTQPHSTNFMPTGRWV